VKKDRVHIEFAYYLGLFFFLFLFFLFRYKENTGYVPPVNIKPSIESFENHPAPTENSDETAPSNKISALEQRLVDSGLVNVQLLDPNIKVSLKYSTTDNFLGIDVYGDFDKAYLQKDVAEKLVNAQNYLVSKHPYYSLIIYDAVRPRSIQRKMWDTVDVPLSERTKYLSNPKYGSLHNYGAAVDISIVNEQGIALDMGTKYDYFGELAYPEREEQMAQQGKLTYQQINNRKLLREVMLQAGFFNIQTEWWHFNSCYRKEAIQKYSIVE